jgi:hypothetical protein
MCIRRVSKPHTHITHNAQVLYIYLRLEFTVAK